MMLLLRGRVVYFGPRGSEAVEYFQAAPLPEGQMMTSLAQGANEAEWIVDITTQADRQQRCCTPAHQTTELTLRFWHYREAALQIDRFASVLFDL